MVYDLLPAAVGSKWSMTRPVPLRLVAVYHDLSLTVDDPDLGVKVVGGS